MATPTRQTPARPARAKQKRGEGQWALGYREPLNPNERSKKDDHPLNVRARIENIYAHRGFDAIDPGDLRGRFRWFGLYTQRKTGIDGGKQKIVAVVSGIDGMKLLQAVDQKCPGKEHQD